VRDTSTPLATCSQDENHLDDACIKISIVGSGYWTCSHRLGSGIVVIVEAIGVLWSRLSEIPEEKLGFPGSKD
jgi:hypothetical protein